MFKNCDMVDYETSVYYAKLGSIPKRPEQFFIYFILEREAIRLRREADLDPPWSSDFVLNQNYFTNIAREDDKVTRWIRNHLNPYVDHPQFELMIMMSRLFNNIPTLEVLDIGPTLSAMPEPLDFDAIHKWIDGVRQNISPFWGSAYLISTNGKPMDKLQYWIEALHEAHHFPIKATRDKSSLYEAYRYLMNIGGLGSFLAAQIIADLKNTPGHPFHAPIVLDNRGMTNQQNMIKDWYTFSAHGKGSLRGLRWYHDYDTPVVPSQYPRLMESCATDTFDVLDDIILDNTEFTEHPELEPQPVSPAFYLNHKEQLLFGEMTLPNMRILCHQNLQNCLCEFDKFMRVLSGSGRSKRSYFQHR